jgi:hypothetical protein
MPTIIPRPDRTQRWSGSELLVSALLVSALGVSVSTQGVLAQEMSSRRRETWVPVRRPLRPAA